MPIYPLTAASITENNHWKPLPLFQGYEINPNREVRQVGSEKILKPTPHRKQLRVSIWDKASHRHRTVSIDYLWEMANADAKQLMRMEMKLRPEMIIQNLLTDILFTYCQPGKLDKMEPRDLIALMKFLYTWQPNIDKNKSTEERHPTIAQMRKYALKLQKKGNAVENGDGQEDEMDSQDLLEESV